MRVAIVHYHLQTGGVTTVIRRQVAALREQCEFLVLSGSPPQPFPAPTACIPALGYDRPDRPPVPATDTARAVWAAIRDRWPSGCDLLHVHNPTLAKNRAFLEILAALQAHGRPLLLQVHDLAEDGRPDVYFDAPYPIDCHWAVINSRDQRLLRSAGLQAVGLHRIDNVVSMPAPAPQAVAPEARVLYPVRALRRKNLGEALLLALFLTTGERLAVTLPPNSPADRASYDDWRRWARETGLAVEFDVGLGADFGTLVASARRLLTTSVGEGFGFAFVEPWLAGKLLSGRRLPDICADFEAAGLDLGHLYDRLVVPLDWLDAPALEGLWRDCLTRSAGRFGITLERPHLRRAFAHLTADGGIDFGLLDESFQKGVLAGLLETPGRRARLAALNPFLPSCMASGDSAALIARNRRVLATRFTPDACRRQLMAVYRRVLATPVKQRLDKRVLVRYFLEPHRFNLLKWKPYAV